MIFSQLNLEAVNEAYNDLLIEEEDYKTLREIADQHGAYLMSDMAHISGLVAGGENKSPFDYCDVVTTTTYVLSLNRFS